MTLSYKRSVRVGRLIQQTIFEIVKEIRDIDPGLVTIMGVKLSDDLLSCRVYYSVFGSDEDKEKVGIVFKKNTKEIRHQLATRLNLRRTPEVFFMYDDTNESADKVFSLLKKIEEEKKRL